MKKRISSVGKHKLTQGMYCFRLKAGGQTGTRKYYLLYGD